MNFIAKISKKSLVYTPYGYGTVHDMGNRDTLVLSAGTRLLRVVSSNKKKKARMDRERSISMDKSNKKKSASSQPP